MNQERSQRWSWPRLVWLAPVTLGATFLFVMVVVFREVDPYRQVKSTSCPLSSPAVLRRPFGTNGGEVSSGQPVGRVDLVRHSTRRTGFPSIAAAQVVVSAVLPG